MTNGLDVDKHLQTVKGSSYNPVIEEWPLHPSFSPSGIWPCGRCDISWPPCYRVGGWHKRAHVCGIQRLAVLSCLIHKKSPRKHLKGHWSLSATFKQKVGPMHWLPSNHGFFCLCIIRMFVVEFTYNFYFLQLLLDIMWQLTDVSIQKPQPYLAGRKFPVWVQL